MNYILFCGGGSAGHAVPNLALMNELRYSHKLAYMGTGGIEKGLVSGAGYPFFQVDCPKLIRKLTPKNFKIPFELNRALKNAKRILQEEKPDLVFSKGGFASYPAVWAAHKLRIPVLTHESDLSAGLCTKLIAKKCEKVLTSFPETAKKFKNGMCVGSPIRKEILSGERTRARKKYGFVREKKPVLLVLGGGSGSKAINEALRARLSAILPHFYVLHLCGKGNAISFSSDEYVQREFESDMGSAYACADVVLSRAGSNTAFELLTLKKCAVFVPLEKSSRGDQLQNALYFEEKGLCAILREEALSDPTALENAVIQTYENDALRSSLLSCGIASGTPRILALIKSIAR